MGSIRTAAPTTTVVPAQAKTDALTEFGVHHLLHAPTLLALPTGGYYRLSEFPNKGNVAAAISNDGAWNLGIVSNLAQGSVGSIRWEFEQAIGSRTWAVITHEYRAGSNGRIVVWDPITLQILDEVPSLGTGPWPALDTAAGSGTFYIGGLGGRGHEARFDAVWITAPGAPLQRPTAAQCVAFYGFDNFVVGGPQPTTSPDSIAGGTAVTLGNATLLADGLWGSPAAGGGGGGPVLTANAFRVVAGTLDVNNIPVGVPVDFEVEVIDTTQGNARVTTFTGEVTLAAVAPFPDGLVVVSGDVSNPAVAGVAPMTGVVFAYGTTPPPPPPAGALAPPSLAVGTAVVTALQVAIPLTIAGPASWPAGVVVQRQTRRGVGAWTALGSPVAPGTGTITFARESAPYTVQLRGIAQAGGTPADSDPSAELTIAVPALASVPVLASVTPLVCDVALFPGSPAPITAAAGGVREELAARAESDNLLVVSNVRRARQRDAHELKAMTMRIDGPSGVLLEDAFNTAGNPSEFTRGISREAFALSRGTLTLTLTLTAQDDSITTIELALPQGVS